MVKKLTLISFGYVGQPIHLQRFQRLLLANKHSWRPVRLQGWIQLYPELSKPKLTDIRHHRLLKWSELTKALMYYV